MMILATQNAKLTLAAVVNQWMTQMRGLLVSGQAETTRPKFHSNVLSQRHVDALTRQMMADEADRARLRITID